MGGESAYLKSLSDEQYTRLFWYASNPPKPRKLSSIPQTRRDLEYWEQCRVHKSGKRIFPPYDLHKKAAVLFGISPAAKYSKGIPACITKTMLSLSPPRSYTNIFSTMYKASYFHEEWKMRVCEVSVGLLAKKTKVSERTVVRSLSFLRGKCFIRLMWRGFPEPQEDRYLHSCYELPINSDHILTWRIHGGRDPKRRDIK